jgi:hypothetical protein
MKYTIETLEENSTDFPQWRERWEEAPVFYSRKEAENCVRILNDSAWLMWDLENPDATEAEEMWAVDHAPCFVITEVEE